MIAITEELDEASMLMLMEMAGWQFCDARNSRFKTDVHVLVSPDNQGYAVPNIWNESPVRCAFDTFLKNKT
jgi:hypothetical protein